GQRGRVLLRESVVVSAAGGATPATDWRPSSLSPDLERSMSVETLGAPRDAVAMAFGGSARLVQCAGTRTARPRGATPPCPNGHCNRLPRCSPRKRPKSSVGQ